MAESPANAAGKSPGAAAPAAAPAAADAADGAPALPEGTLTFDAQALFETQVLAYEQMLGVTEVIGKAVQELKLPSGPEPTYVVVTGEDLDALALLGAVSAAARTLAGAFAGVAPEPAPKPAPDPASGPGAGAFTDGMVTTRKLPVPNTLFAPVGAALDAVRGVLQAAAGVAALFRRDVSIANSAVQVDERAFALQVAGELAFRGMRVRVPGVYAPAPGGAADPFAALDAAYEAAAMAAARVAARPEAQRPMAAAQLDALCAALARLEALAYGGGAGEGGAAPAAHTTGKPGSAGGATTAGAAGAPGEGAGAGAGGGAGSSARAAPSAAASPVASPVPSGQAGAVLALRRAGALAAAVGPGTLLVRPEVLASGGSRRETRGGLKGMLGTALELSGGLVASVSVFTHDGVLVGAGTWTRHSGYQAFEGRTRP